MNSIIAKLSSAGCDIAKGLETSFNDEALYLSSLESFAEDETPQKIKAAFESGNLKKCKMYACSFSRVLYNLGMRELYYINDGIFNSAERKNTAELGRLLNQMIKKKGEYTQIILAK